MRPFAYYSRSVMNGHTYKRCGRCGMRNRWEARRCGCGRVLRKRPRTPKRKDLDARLAEAETMLDRWVTKTVFAIGRVRHYRSRLRVLERERERIASGQPPRPKPRPKPERGIRLRE